MTVPFRWDLVSPDRLGSLLDGVATSEVTYLAELAACAGKVLARSGNGDLVFVGRSLDSMFDLLGGALEDPVRVVRGCAVDRPLPPDQPVGGVQADSGSAVSAAASRTPAGSEVRVPVRRFRLLCDHRPS